MTDVKSRKKPKICHVSDLKRQTLLASLNRNKGLSSSAKTAAISASKTGVKARAKALSPRFIKHMLARKNIHSNGSLLLARGKYYVLVKKSHGLKTLLEINAYTGVIVKRRYIGMRSENIMEYIT